MQSVQDYVLGNRTDAVGVLVRAGLHEVDLFKRRMRPCYNPGTIHRAIRGTWFVDKGTGYAPMKVITLPCNTLTVQCKFHLRWPASKCVWEG